MTRAKTNSKACPQTPPNRLPNAINAPLNVLQEDRLSKKKQSPLLVLILPKTFKLRHRFLLEPPLEPKPLLNRRIQPELSYPTYPHMYPVPSKLQEDLSHLLHRSPPLNVP